MKYKDFSAWFFEGEEYEQRSERFAQSLEAFRSSGGAAANMELWLKAAFEAGRAEKEQDVQRLPASTP